MFTRFWCLKCGKLAKPVSEKEKHDIAALFAKDVEDHDALVVQVEIKAEEAIKKIEQGEQRLLVVEQNHLKTRSNDVAKIEGNHVTKEKLRAVITDCKELKLLPAASKASSIIRKGLEKKLREVEKEVKLADQFLVAAHQAMNKGNQVAKEKLQPQV